MSAPAAARPRPGRPEGTAQLAAHMVKRLDGVDTSWKPRGACARSPRPDWWFAASGEEHVTSEAKRICRTQCPVRAECLAYALAVREPYGTWGGYSHAELKRKWLAGQTA